MKCAFSHFSMRNVHLRGDNHS